MGLVNEREISSEYEKKINTFRVIKNLLYDYYIPLFIRNGPRSSIFESLAMGKVSIDIRNSPKEMNLHVLFLSLFPIVCMVGLLWRREISG